MRVSYGGDRSLEKLCTDEAEMHKKRADVARKLKLRIKALEAADAVSDLKTSDPLGYWHQLTETHAGCWAGKLSANYRLIVRLEEDADISGTVSVTVVGITDYH